MDGPSITPTGFKVLQALNEYRWLTTTQMLRLGIAKDRGNLNKVLTGLVKPRKKGDTGWREKEIGMIDFGALPGVGRMARQCYLAQQGADLLDLFDPDGPPAKPIKHPPRFQNDYFHRVATVDFHIVLARFAEMYGHEISLTRQYFSWQPRSGKTPARPGTSIDLKPGFIDPDSIYRLRAPDGKDRLLLVEIANGKRVDRVVSKFEKYAQVLERRVINQTFSYEKGVRVLWLFENQRTLELVQKRAVENDWINSRLPHFFLRPLAECTPDTLIEGWQRHDPAEGLVALF